MKRHHLSLIVFFGLVAISLVLSKGSPAKDKDSQSEVIVPDSSIEHLEDIGIRMHTNHVILARPQKGPPSGGNGDTVNSAETPASLACIYETAPILTPGCPTSSRSIPPSGGSISIPSGGSETIAIVDAYHYPTAEDDLNTFSTQFGLPNTCTFTHGEQPCFNFKQVSLTSTQNCGWAQEAALDIEWAHAMAPNANIVLVEAPSSGNSEMFTAVDIASNEVLCGQSLFCPPGSNGMGEVSMSWGSSEFSSESNFDTYFDTPGVTYFASSGDSGGKTIFPSTSPNVVSSGGTSIVRNSGTFVTERGWSGSGGGNSRFENRPSYQDPIASIVGTRRGTPDFSFDADPNSGVWVYDSTSCYGGSGWLVFGGTSVSAPSLAGIVNLVSSNGAGFATSLQEEQNTLYSCITDGTCHDSGYFFDVITGKAGKFFATLGWDYVTGIGSVSGLLGK